MRLKPPDRRKFRSSLRERRRRQREYYYAHISILVVKIVLFVFLWMLFYVSARLFHYRFPHLAEPIRYAVPAIICVFALVLGFYIIKDIKELKESYQNLH